MLRHKSAWAAVTVAGLALVAAAGLAAPHWLGQAPRAAAMDTAAGQHSSRTSAQAAAQLDRRAGAKLISSTTAGFTRSRITTRSPAAHAPHGPAVAFRRGW